MKHTSKVSGNVADFLTFRHRQQRDDIQPEAPLDMVEMERLDDTVDTFGEVFQGLTGIFEPLGVEVTFVFKEGHHPVLEIAGVLQLTLVEIAKDNQEAIDTLPKKDLFKLYDALSRHRRGFGRKWAEDYVKLQAVVQHLTSVMDFDLMSFFVGPGTTTTLTKTLSQGNLVALTLDVMDTK